jgi:glyoxylase-like metal-dependent hydrolase (beta-lactamase superfamily II)
MVHTFRMEEVAPGVFFVEGPASNWVILSDGSSVTLIDTGYPADAALVDSSLVQAAPGGALQNILLTHGHSDHTGSVCRLADSTGAQVLAAQEEIANITREELHQIGFAQILPRLWRPRFFRWTMHALRAGGLGNPNVQQVESLSPNVPRIFSQHRVIPRLSPGHTPGHMVFELPDEGIVVTGDALITGHPTSTRSGRQVLDPIWHSDVVGARAQAEALLGDPRIILPGHGPAETR